MALYEYQCRKCRHRFERIQKFSAPDPQCPKCGGRTERLLNAPAVHFKGSGWYVTDYARKGVKKEGASAEGEAQVSKSEDKGKTEDKTEGKAEGKLKGEKKKSRES